MAKGIFGHLLTTRRFLPLFVTQFISAFNDNIFRNALIILVTFKIAEVADAASWMVPMAAGVFILPYFLFSATAGLMADSHDKAKMIRRIKGLEIGIAACAFAAFTIPSVPMLFFTLFLTGVQSAFFGPLKYSILPQHLKENELVAGNAFIETGTFLAILLGTIVGGTLAGLEVNGGLYAGALMLVLAVCAWLCAWGIPSAPPLRTDLKVSWHIWRDTMEIVAHAKSNRSVYLCILGISWFWLFGGVWLSQFPLYVKQVLQADGHLVTLFLTLFSVGIGIGSYICGKLLNGQLHARPVPVAALGMTVFTVDFIIASAMLPPLAGAESRDVWMFLSDWHGIRIAVDLVMVAVMGGIFIVPLYALLQARSEEEHRSRAVAANNIVNALFMVVSSVVVMGLNSVGMGLLPVFALLAVGNLAVALFICGLLPDTVLKSLLRGVLKLCFRVEVKGIEHFQQLGDRALIVANHQSFLDPPLLAAFLPGKQTFAVNTFIAKHPLIRPFLSLVDAFPMDPTNPLSAKALVEHMKEGHKAVIFPEGRITVTGSLMKVYEGPGMIADKADADILPVRIEGAQYTRFSRMKGMVRRRLFPKITITILPPVRLEGGAAAGKARRKQIARSLYDVMSHMMFASSDTRRTLAQALADAADLHGRKHKIIVDVERVPMRYGQLLTASHALGWTLQGKLGKEQYVGVLLPNVRGAAAAFFALQVIGRVPAMLNFSAGIAALHAACVAAQIGTIVTSRKFVEAAGLQEVIAALSREALIVYLEDIRGQIGLGRKLGALWRSRFPKLPKASPDSPAVVLFTSGSEGVPKGVVLSHANLLANIAQAAARVDFGPKDIIFNALPVFHSFGLTAGTLLPILSGIKVFFYPSPLHYRIIPELVYDVNATMLFGTDTFLAGYAKYAHPYDFRSLRYVIAGAEKLKEATRNLWFEKFGIRVFEGYGVTETSPVLSVNTPMHFKSGTVGRLIPDVEYHLEAVPGIAEGGRLYVRGPNIMLAYLKVDQPGVLQPPQDGWHDTGDIVDIDAEGYVTIKGRAKRFAKIGGEMVSLAAVEEHVCRAFPEHVHAVVAVPDERKGEQLVLVTTHEGISRDVVQDILQQAGLTELALPRRIHTIASMPLLGSGKTDYPAVQKLVEGKE